MSIKWQEPPASTRGRKVGAWGSVVEDLRSRPGQWALVAESNPSATIAVRLSRGKAGGAQPGEIEATTRKRPDGTFDIYARFIGGDPR